MRPAEKPWRKLLAEGLVIVFSILLALWGDAVWSDRADRIDERELLTAVHQELRLNRTIVSTKIDTIQDASARLRSLVAMTPAAVAGLPRDSLATLIREPLFRLYTAELAVGELNSAVSSGRVGLIENGDVRSALATYQANMGDAAEIAAMVAQVGLEARLASARIPNLAPWVAWPADVEMATPESVAAILRSPELVSLIAVKAELFAVYRNELIVLLEQIDRLVTDLETQLGL